MVGTYVGKDKSGKDKSLISQAYVQGIFINATIYEETQQLLVGDYPAFPQLTMFLDLLPFMVFTNMFAIFYLETICMTKTTA